jgi:hypothetical protein
MTNEQVVAMMKLINENGKVMDMCIKTLDLHTSILSAQQKEIEKLQVRQGETEADSKTALYKIKKLEGK